MKDVIYSYQDLQVWQKAMDLVTDCYVTVKQFPATEKYGLTNQLQRSAVSVPANIAEGHGRGYTKDYMRHVSIAKGSLAELETHLQIAQRLGYLKMDQLNGLLNKANTIGRMLTGLQKSLVSKPKSKPLTPNSQPPAPSPHNE